MALTAALPAFADDPAPSPESTLMQTLLTLKGLDLSKQEMQLEMSKVVANYDQAAPVDGRSDRLQTALVDLEIMTVQQAKAFVGRANQAEATVETAPTAEAKAQALQDQLTLFGRINPVGAQFSAACTVGLVATLGGIMTMFIGYDDATTNPTCHPDQSKPYSCEQQVCQQCSDGYDDNGNAQYHQCNCTYVNETCYPTVCDKPDYYPHARRGHITMYAGAAAIAAGIALIIFNYHDCE
jgi:hypothetical protein